MADKSANPKQYIPTDLEKIVSRTYDSSEPYRAMMEYLGLRNAVPTIRQNSIDELGSFARISEKFPTGRITLNLNAGATTLTHEAAHATTDQFLKQALENKTTGADKQFTDAYNKLIVNTNTMNDEVAQIPILDFVEKIAPQWAKEQANYRATIAELPSFAIERAVISPDKGTMIESPPHIDSTLATEMTILLDLATRAQKAKSKSQGR